MPFSRTREKEPIIIIGFANGLPIPILNMFAHRVVDNHTARIIKLSTIGGSLNTLQHYGFNSRDVTITGRVNMIYEEGHVGGVVYNSESILVGTRIMYEARTPVLIILNHGAFYGQIESIKLIDDRDYPTAYDYEMRFVEKDIFGIKLTTMLQTLIIGTFSSILNMGSLSGDDNTVSIIGVDLDGTIPNFPILTPLGASGN